MEKLCKDICTRRHETRVS